MKIHIEKNIYLESDTYGYAVKTYADNKNKDGKDIVIDAKYYTTLQGCIKCLLNMKIKESTATTLKELLGEVNDIYSYVEKQIEKVKIYVN
jgi:hypothetical protein